MDLIYLGCAAALWLLVWAFVRGCAGLQAQRKPS